MVTKTKLILINGRIITLILSKVWHHESQNRGSFYIHTYYKIQYRSSKNKTKWSLAMTMIQIILYDIKICFAIIDINSSIILCNILHYCIHYRFCSIEYWKMSKKGFLWIWTSNPSRQSSNVINVGVTWS